ncbi:MAG TPA: aminoglycoside phosphotransferase family protein [Gaiellaceae bacterium]
MQVPGGLLWWREEPGGAEWLDRLPRLVAELAEGWGLELERPFEPAHTSLVVPARRTDGSAAVLKANFPEPESEHEAAALACWSGAGAVRLLARDDERRALLVERCFPGTVLWEVEERHANEIAAGVVLQLWQALPAGDFGSLDEQAAQWADSLPASWAAAGRPFERELLDEAVAFLRAPRPQEDPVLLHQDLHGGNVLRSERGWLAIDPKPLVGERAFDLASLLRDRRDELVCDPRAGARVERRLDFFSERLELERERVRGWGIAHALAWGFQGGEVLPDHVECARLLAGTRG